MSDLGNCLVFADNLERLMKQRCVKSVDVCSSIGISKSTYSNWLNARMYPRIDRIEQLANYFNVSKSDLVERNGIISDNLVVLTNNEKIVVELMRNATETQQKHIIMMLQYTMRMLDEERKNRKEDSSPEND